MGNEDTGISDINLGQSYPVLFLTALGCCWLEQNAKLYAT